MLTQQLIGPVFKGQDRPFYPGPKGSPETLVTAIQRCVIYQKGEDLHGSGSLKSKVVEVVSNEIFYLTWWTLIFNLLRWKMQRIVLRTQAEVKIVISFFTTRTWNLEKLLLLQRFILPVFCSRNVGEVGVGSRRFSCIWTHNIGPRSEF